MLHGSNSTLAIENMLRRAENRRQGNTAPDGRKLALVIEGGGMRSVCSGAGAAALCQLGFSSVFDEVFATSAGVMNASYFITNQPLVGMSVYFENCATREFMNPWRFWKLLNVDYIIDRVAAIEKPLDQATLAASPTQLFISMCDHRTGEIIVVDTRATQTPILQVLKAAMAIPVFYNRTVEVDGRRCIDSGTILPFPLDQALERGCTDILVLLTRPVNFVEKQPPWAMRRIFDMVHRSVGTGLSRAFTLRHEKSQLMRDLAVGRIAAPPGVNIAAICTEECDRVESTSTRREVTYAAAVRYGRKTMQVFGRDPDELMLSGPS
ncbi:MAG: hypothetical protein JWM11_7265 [Planctomycetaceae bacterium]|nr:hypothetical protein [Planctomycetaceae bacterium]